MSDSSPRTPSKFLGQDKRNMATYSVYRDEEEENTPTSTPNRSEYAVNSAGLSVRVITHLFSSRSVNE
jgi:hypothetical protein